MRELAGDALHHILLADVGRGAWPKEQTLSAAQVGLRGGQRLVRGNGVVIEDHVQVGVVVARPLGRRAGQQDRLRLRPCHEDRRTPSRESDEIVAGR